MSYRQLSIAPSVTDMERMAKAIAASKLFGMQNAEQALALMIVAQAQGRHPGTVAQEYHIINGRPALKADTMLARFLEAGGRVEWHAYTDEKADATFTHPASGSVRLDWTYERARNAGVTGNPTWNKYRRAMLRARVISEGVRTVYPGVLGGMYEESEVRDMTAGTTDAPRSQEPVQEAEVMEGGAPALEMTREIALATKMHWGKNRGLMLSELTAPQLNWLADDWLLKKENDPVYPPTADDRGLMVALKFLFPLAGDKRPAPSEVSPLQHLGELAADAGIQLPELENHLRQHVRLESGTPVLREGVDFERIPVVNAHIIINRWTEIKDAILAARHNQEAAN